MFQRILVPLDGSRRAEMAVPAAAHLARAAHGSVILLRSITPLTPYWPSISKPSGPATTQSSQERDTALSYLRQVADGEALAGMSTALHVTDGPAAESILAMSQAEGVDLIVICAHGLTGYHRWKLGGVSQHVVRHAVAPVLLLPDPAPGGDPVAIKDQLAGLQRVVVPLDGSLLAETAIPAAVELLAALAPLTGELHLLQVASPFTAKALAITEERLQRQVEKDLREVAERLRATSTEHLNLTITSSAVLDSDAAERIIITADPEYADSGESQAHGFDVIVMATHGRTGIMRWALGSTTERVLQETPKPMLIVRPVAVETPTEGAQTPVEVGVEAKQ